MRGVRGALEKTTLALPPPWTTIFKGEGGTLEGEGHHPLVGGLRAISPPWELGHLVLPSHGRSNEGETPGVYRCQNPGAPLNDPGQLFFSKDWLILQVPYAPVFEGEPLVLRCRGWYDKAVHKLHYYRDGRAVRYFGSGANYSVPQARAGDSGRYQCSGTMRLPVESAPMFSAPVAVTVRGGCERARGGPGLGGAGGKRRVRDGGERRSGSATRPPSRQGPKPAPLAPGNQPLSSRKALPSTSAPSVISAPNATSAGPRAPAGRAPGAPPAACAPQTPLEPTAGALKPEVDLLLREIRLLKGLLSRVVLGMRGPQAAPEPGTARGTAAPCAESPETSAAGS
ncbi:Fc receptor-like B [Myotis lucifugus]|uniref:Fc receptor-like B n=1 Tax=Myotis lucifugus TaxID=59463 RepID=UPI0006D73C30|nr:Fc receptor-like B [Myotis lucifugus]